jgi:hypothetical protein
VLLHGGAIRKVIEHETVKGTSPYPLLYFFCNWAMHVKMFKDAKNMRRLTSPFDLQNHMTIEDYLQSHFFQDTMNFQQMRDELRRFLQLHSLPTDLTDRPSQWLNLVDLYTAVVSSVRLDLSRTNLLPDDVEELTIFRRHYPDGLPTLTVWQVKLKNGLNFQSQHLYNTSVRLG